jgi:uncharacterized membrane protein YbhN (UPF0104 family)
VSDEPESGRRAATREVLVRRLLIGGFLSGGLLAAGLALWQSVASAGEEVLPPASRWIIAALLAGLWLYLAVEAWVALFEAPQQRQTLTGALVLSQLGKYVPGGGIVQVTGMVAMSRNEHVSTSRLALGPPVIGLSALAVGGVALGVIAIFDTSLPGWARVLGLLGWFAPLLLWRPVMAFTVNAIRRVIARTPPPDDLPSQRAILISGSLTSASLVATGMAYAVLVHPSYEDSHLVSLTLAYMVAWTAGFLVLPLPGGIGVREAVLAWLIGGPAVSVVGASIALRIINIGIELVAVGIHFLAVRVRSGRQGSTES